MREDIAKVICERQRYGGRIKYPKGEKRRWNNIPDEEKPYKEPGDVRRKWKMNWQEDKKFGENLGALKGYALKCVGRNWDDVYSEICKYIDKGNVVQNHVLTHLYQYIERNAVVKDGIVYDAEYPMHKSYALVYVDPETKIIKRNTNIRKRYRRKQRKVVSYPATKESFYLKDDNGVWWECFVKPYPEPTKYPITFENGRDYRAIFAGWRTIDNGEYDQYFQRIVKKYDINNFYCSGAFYCYKKLQLSKSDIRKVKRKHGIES